MRRPAVSLLILSGAFASAAASLAHAGGLPHCDGKHRRPANPYGSVLAAGLKPAPAEDAAHAPRSKDGSAAGASPARPVTVSRTAEKASLAACGSGRA